MSNYEAPICVSLSQSVSESCEGDCICICIVSGCYAPTCDSCYNYCDTCQCFCSPNLNP